MRVGLAFIALAAIDVVEAMVSAAELAARPGRGRPDLTFTGGAQSAFGFVASLLVYALLARAVLRAGGDGRLALRDGMIAGVLAGVVGAAVTLITLGGYLQELGGRYGAPAELSLAIAGVFAFLVSVFGGGIFGGALTWLAHLVLSRTPRRPPP